MPIPDYQKAMLPVLKFLRDGRSKSRAQCSAEVADKFSLTTEERRELLPSGKSTVIRSRTGWALTYLYKAGAVSRPKRGTYVITDRGRSLLAENLTEVTNQTLERFDEFVDFRTRESKDEDLLSEPAKRSTETPEEALETAYQQLRSNLETDLLEQIKASSSEFFEYLVVDLLVKMGYGGTLKDAGQAVGKSNDGGIDGIIKEDRLGLDAIYIQAKKWEDVVSRPEIQKFAGALQGRRARKGVFLTTSSFSKGAIEYVGMIESKIVLIDGNRLASLMIDHGVGTSTVTTYELKQIDMDYFNVDQ